MTWNLNLSEAPQDRDLWLDANSALEAEEVGRLLHYVPDTGRFYWCERPRIYFTSDSQWKRWNTRYARKEAFTALSSTGYREGAIFRRTFKAHRVAWLLFHGRWPEGQIDHINGNRADNRICNLRDVTQTENNRNQTISLHNSSGFCGVFWHQRQRKWCARVGVSGKQVHLGSFDSFDEAVSARQRANVDYGFTARHGTRNPITKTGQPVEEVA